MKPGARHFLHQMEWLDSIARTRSFVIAMPAQESSSRRQVSEMKHVLLPKNSTTDRQEKAPEISLGGCFYDYLRSADGRVVGVRYWVIEPVKFEEHPVYSQFLGDGRFAFDQAGGCVDIVFDEYSAALLQKGELTVEVVQEFGGESVVKCGERFGIVFSLSDDATPTSPSPAR